MTKHKKTCLEINGKQNLKLKADSIKFKNYFKQLAVPFKIYADFESLLKGVKCGDNNITSCTEKYQDHIPCSFAYKVVYTDSTFIKKAALYRGKNSVYIFIEAILEEHYYCQKIIKKHFSESLVISAKDEGGFQLINISWICDKLFDAGDNKVRDHCHITGNYRGSAYWSCNINLKLAKKVTVIFHNLKGYDSHLIMQEIVTFDVKVSVKPNGLEKYMAFTINKNLVFIDSTQFMNSSLE